MATEDTPSAAPGAPQDGGTFSKFAGPDGQLTNEGGPPDTASGEPKPEATPEPQPEAKPEDDRVARGFALLSRREKQVREREAAVKAAESEVKEFRELREAAKRDPRILAKVFGDDIYDRMTLAHLDDGEEKPKDEVAELRARLDAREQAEREAAEARKTEQQARDVQTAKHVFRKHAEAAGEKYEAVLAHGDEAMDLAYAVADAYYNEHGKAPLLDDVLRHVEGHYEAQHARLAGLKKFGSGTRKPTSEGQRTSESAPTLTSRVNGEAPVNPADEPLSLDPDERDRQILRQHRLYT
jgi:hypothetical protein